MYVQKPPLSKRELVNRLLSNDFNGDFRSLGEGAQISRAGPNLVEIRFPEIDRTFMLSAHIPRDGTAAHEDDFAAPLPKSTRKPGSKQ